MPPSPVSSADDDPPPLLAYESPVLERSATAEPTESVLEAHAHDPYAALRMPDFFRFTLGFGIAVVGQQMLSVAVGWEIYQRTNSPGALGTVGLVQALPVILLALPAGQVADKFSRKYILLITQILVALCSIALAWLSYANGPISMFYGLLVLMAICRAFNDPTRNAFIPQLLPVHLFSNAVTWNSSGFQVAAMVGPALGGGVIAWMLGSNALAPWAFPAIYLINAATALLFALLISWIRNRPVAHRGAGSAVTLQTLGAGILFVWRTKIILATITLDLFAVLLGGAVALLPVYARDILHTGPTGLGWMRAAPSLGAVCMALILAHRPPMKHAGKTLLCAVAGFGAATVVFGLSRNFYLSLFMLFLTGVFDNVSVVVRHTLVQLLTPDAMRGRVGAVNNVFIGASNELGEFESGYSAAFLERLRPGAGSTLSVVLGGIGSMVVVALGRPRLAPTPPLWIPVITGIRATCGRIKFMVKDRSGITSQSSH